MPLTAGGVVPGPAADGAARGPLRIVVADDAVLLREGLVRLLAEDGHQVVAAVGDGPALVEAVLSHRPDVSVVDVRMHDGSLLRLRKLEEAYDPRDKVRALTRIAESQGKGEVLTGVLYVDPEAPTFLDLLQLPEEPLATLPTERQFRSPK